MLVVVAVFVVVVVVVVVVVLDVVVVLRDRGPLGLREPTNSGQVPAWFTLKPTKKVSCVCGGGRW